MAKRLFSNDQIQDGIARLERDLASQDDVARKDMDLRKIREISVKRKLFSTIHNNAKRLNGIDRSIFISFPGRLEDDCKAIKDLALNEFGFNRVITGFDPEVRTAKTLRSGIIYAIREASSFLGIWTDDYVISAPGSDERRFSPGAWMPIELGIALSMEKPFRLLLKNGLHREVINPVDELPHFWFKDQRELDRMAREALQNLSDSIRLLES